MFKILVFGDSIGYGKRDREGGWVARLRKRVDETYNFGEQCSNAQVYNCCIPGETALRMQQRFAQECVMKAVDMNPDVRVIVIFAVGINDSCLQPRIQEKQTSVEEFTDAMMTMITFCQNQKHTSIILGLTPVDETKRGTFFQNAIIRTYDDELKTLAKHADVQYIPLFDRFLAQGLVDRMSDGIHPDDEGHGVVFEEVRRCITNL